MATYNSVADLAKARDAAGKTIADYAAEYNSAKGANSASGMAAANAAANAIRTANGAQTVYAGQDIANTAKYDNNTKNVPTNTTTGAPSNSQLISLLQSAYSPNAAVDKLTSAYNQNVADLQAARAKISPTYTAERNQTAGNYDVEQKNVNEIFAANGLNTGTTGQAALARSSTLQNNLNSLNKAEGDALAANDLQLAKLSSEYKNAVAEAENSGNASLAEALYNEYVREAEAQTTANADNRKYAYSTATDMIQSGIVPSDALLSEANISKDDASLWAQYYKAQAAAAAAKKSSSGSSGSSGGKKSSSSGGKKSSSSGDTAQGTNPDGDNFDITQFDTDYLTNTKLNDAGTYAKKNDNVRWIYVTNPNSGTTTQLSVNNFANYYKNGWITLTKNSNGSYTAYYNGTK
jgi:hypothetical protein